jgi:hypothetical protein
MAPRLSQVEDGRDDLGRFAQGNPGRRHGSRNKTNVAIAQAIAATRKPPLEMMLDIADYYYRQWLQAKEAPERRFAAELTLQASRLAAPYVHAKKIVIEEDTPVAINVIDRRDMGRVIAVNGSNGHGSNGSNGHGGNGSNGHEPNGNGSSEAFN